MKIRGSLCRIICSHPGDSLPDHLRGDPIPIADQLDRLEDGPEVLQLVCSHEWQIDGAKALCLHSVPYPPNLLVRQDLTRPISEREGRLLLGCLSPHYLQYRLIGAPPQHHRGMRLDDSRLLMGYLTERVAEELHVIHAHIRDHADEGAEDVGTVEPTAHTDLHHGYVHLLIHKVAEGERRGQFKERRL